MNKIDKNLVDSVAQKILKVMKQTANKTINASNVEVYHKGVVTVAPTDTDNNTTVELSFGGTITVPNLSNQPLSVGDWVKIYSDKQNLVGAYIGLKY